MSEAGSEIVLKQDSDKTAEAVKTSVETRGGRVEFGITLGDITEAKTEAIVCPANPGFEFGIGAVQGAIERKAGMGPFDEAERKAKAYIAGGGGVKSPDNDFMGAPLGFAIATSAGKLKDVKKIIHVNNMRDDDKLPPCDEEVVRLAVSGSLAAADAAGIKSIAFPAMGTGIWGMTMAESIRGTVQGVRDYYQDINPNSRVKKVSFVVYAQPSLKNASEMRKILLEQVLPGNR